MLRVDGNRFQARLMNVDLSSEKMQDGPRELAQVRLDNALALFDEFVRLSARHADAAALRGLERRFAERVQIQPSYWSQIKGRSRQIGERLARQFEQQCHKPRGWLDLAHDAASAGAEAAPDESLPRDDDERFMVGLVLTFYRRHPQRARARLLELLGEVLVPSATPPVLPPASPSAAPSPRPRAALSGTPAAEPEDAQTLWRRSQTGVAPLKRHDKRR